MKTKVKTVCGLPFVSVSVRLSGARYCRTEVCGGCWMGNSRQPQPSGCPPLHEEPGSLLPETRPDNLENRLFQEQSGLESALIHKPVRGEMEGLSQT